MIAHIVLLRPKPDLSHATIRSFAQSFVDACSAIPSIRRASVGPVLPSNYGRGSDIGDKTYTVAALLEFEDRSGLVRYLSDPLHRKLGGLFWDCSDIALAIDAEMGPPTEMSIESLFGLKTK